MTKRNIDTLLLKCLQSKEPQIICRDLIVQLDPGNNNFIISRGSVTISGTRQETIQRINFILMNSKFILIANFNQRSLNLGICSNYDDANKIINHLKTTQENRTPKEFIKELFDIFDQTSLKEIEDNLSLTGLDSENQISLEIETIRKEFTLDNIIRNLKE